MGIDYHLYAFPLDLVSILKKDKKALIGKILLDRNFEEDIVNYLIVKFDSLDFFDYDKRSIFPVELWNKYFDLLSGTCFKPLEEFSAFFSKLLIILDSLLDKEDEFYKLTNTNEEEYVKGKISKEEADKKLNEYFEKKGLIKTKNLSFENIKIFCLKEIPSTNCLQESILNGLEKIEILNNANLIDSFLSLLNSMRKTGIKYLVLTMW